MKIAFYGTRNYERQSFEAANAHHGHQIRWLEPRLNAETAPLAAGSDVVCAFVNDHLDRKTLTRIAALGVRLVALRCAGFNQVDLDAAHELGVRVVRVSAYSPHAVAEHAVALILSLNRRIHRANSRVHEHNFSLDGLVGFDLHGKTIGVVGTGRIGAVFARILSGFGCRILAYDLSPDPSVLALPDSRYTDMNELLEKSDIVSLHLPLTPETRHLIDNSAFQQMKVGAMLVNTSRGGLVDARALVGALKTGRLGGAALDVYEEEEGLFFEDCSDRVLQDDTLARLLSFPNVLVTAHQAFLTREALQAIAETTLQSVTDYSRARPLANEVLPPAATAGSPPPTPTVSPKDSDSRTETRRNTC